MWFHDAATGNQPVALDLICTEIACSGAFIEAALFAQDDIGDSAAHCREIRVF
jgi:hypothetical protein